MQLIKNWQHSLVFFFSINWWINYTDVRDECTHVPLNYVRHNTDMKEHKTPQLQKHIKNRVYRNVTSHHVFIFKSLPSCTSWRISSVSAKTPKCFIWKILLTKSCKSKIYLMFIIDGVTVHLSQRDSYTSFISEVVTVEHGCAKSLSAPPVSFHCISCTVGGAMSKGATRSE